MPYIIAVIFPKGGVTKSCTTAELAAAITVIQPGARVLAIDADHLGGLTDIFQIDKDGLDAQTYHLLEEPDAVHDPSLYHESAAWPGVHVIASNMGLKAFERSDIQTRDLDWHQHLRRVLYSLPERYDVVLVDCHGDRSLLSQMAVTSADLVLSPIEPTQETFTKAPILEDMLAQAWKVRPRLPHRVFLTKYKRAVPHQQQYAQEIRAYFADRMLVAEVYDTTAFSKAHTAGKPLIHFERSHAAAQAYLSLAKELQPLWQTTLDHRQDSPSA